MVMGVFLLLGMVDVIFADVAQPDQARIVALNAHSFLKNDGFAVMSIKVINCLFQFLFNLGLIHYSTYHIFNPLPRCTQHT